MSGIAQDATRHRLRARVLVHAIAFLLVWPFLSAAFAVLAIGEQSVAKNASIDVVAGGALLGTLQMWPEFLATGAILALLTILLFTWIVPETPRPLLLLLEPFLFTIAVTAGLALEYPAVLSHPAFRLLRPLEVMQATMLTTVAAVILIAAYGMLAGRKLSALRGALAATVIIAIAWAQAYVPAFSKREASRGGTVVFGIDSLGFQDRIEPLQEFARKKGGTWYENAVTPALVTNAVWSSILMNRLPYRSGVYLIYQAVDWKRAPYNLVAHAKRAGYETWSFMTSQFTSYVGSRAGFDHDRSSAVGWRYIASGFIKDSSVFLPVVLPRLPALPFASTPRNQEGTFTYDVRQNIRAALTAGADEKPSFVCAHFDYLHANAYPRYAELSPELRSAIRSARVDALQDQSLDPEAPVAAGDPISLHAWKTQRMQQVLIEEIATTRFLENENRIVIFSDHGIRRGLNATNFGRRDFSHVVLLTVGVPARDPKGPISLTDIPELIGLGDPSTPPTPAVVQHAAVLPVEAVVIQESIRSRKRGSRLAASGEVILDPLVVANVGRRLVTYGPFVAGGTYWRTPASRTPWALSTRAE